MQYARLDTAFHRLGIVSGAPENHGILCGLLCARGEIDRDDWFSLLIADSPAGEAVLRPAGRVAQGMQPMRGEWTVLSDLYAETLRELREPATMFRPLLPDDDAPLGQRAEAVAGWCRGFVYGLGAGGVEDPALLPDDVREITSDIIEISRASSETDDGEEDETAYTELVEYLRAGVTLVYEILESGRRDPGDHRTLH